MSGITKFARANACVMGSLLLAALLLGGCSGRKEAGEVPLGEVMKGTLYLDLYEEGAVEAIKSVAIAAPMISWRYGNLKINWLVKDGEEVKIGDTLIRFDQTEVQKGIDEAESALEVSMAELKKMEAQHKSDLEELNADYQVAEISKEISKIRFETSAYESDIKRREIQLNLAKADLSLTRAKEQIDNKVKIQKEEFKQKELSIKQSQNQLDEARDNLKRLSVITASPGIAIIETNYTTDKKFQLGDQIWAGRQIITLPDLSKMKATVRINEVDIAKIVKDMDVEIRPDAFSETTFKGKVHSVANLAVNKDGSSKIKVFPVEIYIDGENKELLPGLTVSCRIIVDKLEDVLYVPLTAVHEEAGKSYVYVKTGSGYEKTEVEAGAANSDYVAIVEGLKEGQKIALTNPYAGAKGESADADKETLSE